MVSKDGAFGFELDTQLRAICQNGRVNGSELFYERLDRLAASCGRACMVALEDKIGNRFNDSFRKVLRGIGEEVAEGAVSRSGS